MPKTDQEKTDALTKLLFATSEERQSEVLHFSKKACLWLTWAERTSDNRSAHKLREPYLAALQMTLRLSLISLLCCLCL